MDYLSNFQFQHYPLPPEDENIWETNLEEIYACGATQKPRVAIKDNVLIKILFFLNKYPDLEWAGDLIGEFITNENLYKITDFIIFEQEVTGASVHRKETISSKTIGLIHSHNKMKAYFSAKDDSDSNPNHNVAICVAHSKEENHIGFEYAVEARIKTPCGKLIRYKNIQLEIQIENSVWEKENEKIKIANLIPSNRYITQKELDEYGLEKDRIPAFSYEDLTIELIKKIKEQVEKGKQISKYETDTILSWLEETEYTEELSLKEDTKNNEAVQLYNYFYNIFYTFPIEEGGEEWIQ